MPATDVHLRDNAPQGQLAMTGPCTGIDGASLPVRGDLAHIKLAGRYFVPHYAVPVAFTAATGGAALRSAASSDADVLATLDAGTAFNVLDIAGSWAWGQVGEDGLVGYVALPDLNASGQ